MNHSPNSNSKPSLDATTTEPNALWQEAKQAVSQVADQAGEKIKNELDTKKGFAVDKATEMASKLRDTKDALKDVGPLPDLADQAADQIERLAEYVQNRNLGDLVREVERFARREPAIFLGVSFAAGLLGGRFLKSSGRRSRRPDSRLDTEYAYIQDEPRFGADTFAAPLPERKPEPMRTSTTTSPYSSLSSSSSSTPATRPAMSSPLPPVPPPMMERRTTQPMPAIKADSDLASKPSTSPGFASTTTTKPGGSFVDSVGKTNGTNGSNGNGSNGNSGTL